MLLIQHLHSRPVRFLQAGSVLVAVLVLFVVGLIASPAAHAQFDTATVVGTVTDPSGAVVAGANVSLRNTELGTVLTRKTNTSGIYEFPDVQIGTYTVTVRNPGFADSVTKPFDLIVAARQRVDVPLAVGNASESVTVTLSDAGLQTESGDRSTTIEREETIDLPLNGREVTDLALLVPGAQISTLEDNGVDQRRSSIVVNGNRASVNNFLLDGLDNNSYSVSNQGFSNMEVSPSADAVQQTTIITSNFAAEYGRAGGAIFNARTKSGTEALHGSLFEYLRDTIFNAYGPFVGTGIKPGFVQNQFGGSVGYHVPHIKDFFFFIDYEGIRQDSQLLSTEIVPTDGSVNPTDNQRAGMFVAPRSSTDPTLIPVPLKNPLTSVTNNSGIISASDTTPFAAAVLGALPHPNFVPPLGTGNTNFQALEGQTVNRDLGDIRLDKYFGNRLQTFARVSKQASHIGNAPGITGPAGGGGYGHVRVLTSSGVAGATYALTPNSVLDLRLGITFTNAGKVPYNQGLPNFYSPFNIPFPVSPSLQQSGLNTQAVYKFSTFGVEDSNNEFSNSANYNIKTNYTLAKGRHSYSFGYEYLQVNAKVNAGFPVLGYDDYQGAFSTCSVGCQATPYATNARTQAYELSDFIFGAPNVYEIGNYSGPTEYYDFDYAYAEDSWKILPRLTLTYGLRYEFATPERARGATLSNFDPTTNALVLASSGSIYNEAKVNPKLDDFAPRFGFAYSVFPNIVFRGGYGISYIQWNRGYTDLLSNAPTTFNNTVTQYAPTSKTNAEALCANGSQSLTCFRTTMQGFPNSLFSNTGFSPVNVTTEYVPRNLAPGYVESFSLGTQVQLTRATILNIGYAGSHNVHEHVLTDYNQAPPLAPGSTLTLQARRPITNFASIETSVAEGYLKYNALQVQLTHRARGGLFLLNSFTWSKAIDNASTAFEANYGNGADIVSGLPSYNNGISGYDQRLNDSLGAVWHLPSATQLKNRVLRQATSGWVVTTITRLTTGIPLDITYDIATANEVTTLGYIYRPNFTGQISKLNIPRSQWVVTPVSYGNTLSTTGLSIPSGNSPFGNIPKDPITGPNYANIDLGLQKLFSLPKHTQLQFRVEAFNLLNHTNFKGPDVDYSSSTFGQYGPGNVFPSRQLQFAIRYAF